MYYGVGDIFLKSAIAPTRSLRYVWMDLIFVAFTRNGSSIFVW